MSRFFLLISTAAFALIACASPGASPRASQPTVSDAPTTPSPATTPIPTLTALPSAEPTVAAITADEQFLIDGVRRGATGCRPVREDLPPQAIAGIECASDDPGVARIGFYLFGSDKAMLAAYFARMDAEGVKRDGAGCYEGEEENAYIPGEGVVPARHGCFVNAQGYANYRATIDGDHVYIGILGRNANMRALEDFAWRGNEDVPGSPTLWGHPDG